MKPPSETRSPQPDTAAGWSHTCGIRTDGTVTCWGDNTHAQADPPPGEFNAIAAGGTHSCGIRTDGTITCWGTKTRSAPTPTGVQWN